MSEAQWVACESWVDFLKVLPADASARKLRLFAVACCRRLPGLAERSTEALDVAERHAEGLADRWALRRAYMKAYGVVVHHEDNPGDEQGHNAAQAVAWAVVAEGIGPREITAYAAYYAGRAVPGVAERGAQFRLLADTLLAPPSATVSPAWLAWNGGTVGDLARAIEKEQAFDRLPILADALEDAGCADAALLDHCRGPGPHVRGCWVVDLILGKP
jgi:hypothetical protein